MVLLVLMACGCATRDPSPGESIVHSNPKALDQITITAARTASPSVVQVVNVGVDLGSGVVLDRKGNVVTNDHVVKGAHQVQVLFQGRTVPARIVAEDESDDLAVIRMQQSIGTPIRFADSSSLVVGQGVLALGNPLGLTSTVTSGLISALDRTVEETTTYVKAFQTSAPINPGNSGGALVDLWGRLVGMPTLAATDPTLGGAAVGIAFAIPSNTVRFITGQMIAHGRVLHTGRAFLGVLTQGMTDHGQQGLTVLAVTPGGPADRAGIGVGDFLQRVAGITLPQTINLEELLNRLRPGQRIEVDYLHQGRPMHRSITLGELPSTPSEPPPP